MKCVLPIVVILSAAGGLVLAGEEIADKELGLSQTSVFDTPEPAPYGYDGSAPAIPALSPLEVPVIPHEIKSFEKITVGRNRCLNCHDQPDMIGAAVAEGDPTPIPASHYLDNAGDPETAKVAGSRWVCTQCHVAQANTKLLVGNTTVD